MRALGMERKKQWKRGKKNLREQVTEFHRVFSLLLTRFFVFCCGFISLFHSRKLDFIFGCVFGLSSQTSLCFGIVTSFSVQPNKRRRLPISQVHR